jgi:hypothetical protein
MTTEQAPTTPAVHVATFDNLLVPLAPEVERQLLQRIHLVQVWVAAFAASLGKRRPPRIKTQLSPGHVYYAPVENILKVPSRHLLTLSDLHLRMAVAHEMGHFSRRWPSLFAWTLTRRLDEEVHADRRAIELTGASVDEWASSILAVAAIEEPGEPHEQDFIFQARKKLLQRWVDKRTSPSLDRPHSS